MRKNILLAIGYWLLAVGLIGCGYTTRSTISDKYRTIYILPFLNKIDITSEAKGGLKYQVYRPLLETDVTKAVIDRFMMDGNLRIAKDQNSDLILKGSLVDFRRDVLRYATDEETPEEYRISISVDLNLWDRAENKPAWEEKGFTGEASYFVTGANAKSDSAAITDATVDLARRIVARTVEQW